MIWRCENDFNKRQILPPLTKNRIVEGVQGKGGGYRLVRTPEEYTIGDILRITERDLAPVSCLAEGAEACERRDRCQTIEFWEGLNKEIYFTSGGSAIASSSMATELIKGQLVSAALKLTNT